MLTDLLEHLAVLATWLSPRSRGRTIFNNWVTFDDLITPYSGSDFG
jgi:hypothetical protein